ncbi:hypothetical protein [uncultured Dialister sp.]|jgi:hypothetical protein|uniref:hypothetical protein n=1 Tax=uncultured Dialister sp. TaxID=278064 RepID=UPI0025F4A870|nr:hypothetical protein [uncultured Dialister sp.]
MMGQTRKDKNKVRSWELMDDHTLTKKTDKSVFRYGGATVPMQMHSFFAADDMNLGDSRYITIRYDGHSYQGRLEKEQLYMGRVRIFWDKDLKEVFGELLKDHESFPLLVITRQDKDTYAFEMRFATEPKEFHIILEETVTYGADIEAFSEKEAKEKVEKLYKQGKLGITCKAIKSLKLIVGYKA